MSPSEGDARNENGDAAVVVPWAQQASTPVEHRTDRRRHMVQGLPSWEPLPPGEIYVQRHRSD
ncbi:hypothetical protein MED01_006082 [Micromonospora sp. MED01]|uniref:hypothetical protein n=1 Tax=Micromonospora alfalfae TaxID=2911212 RepID=UPI001EE8F8E7|nr:hypothetical protein [Micromonospora alfalfae]MCG5467032.1 hypothetical protein [Micromonospora alfalfae]